MLKYLFIIIVIILVNEKDIKENELIYGKSINNKLEISDYKILDLIYNIEDIYTNDIIYNENTVVSEEKGILTLDRNIINLKDSLKFYYFNLNDIKENETENIQLLLYTNLTNNIYFLIMKQI